MQKDLAGVVVSHIIVLSDFMEEARAEGMEAVAAHRMTVWWSVVTHVACSVALLGAGAITISSCKPVSTRLTRCGAWLVPVGAMGVCMDGFFHLTAFYLTAPGIELQRVLKSMP